MVNILLSVSMFVGLLLGMLILISNNKKAVNRALAFVLFATVLWLASNLSTNLSPSPTQALYFARSTLVGASLLPVAFLIFCKAYARQLRLSKLQIALIFVPTLLLILAAPTKLNIVSINAYGQDTVTGSIYFLLVPVVIAYFAWGLVILTKYYQVTRKAVERAQLRYIFAGVVSALVPTIILNGILPIFGNNVGVLYGPNAVMLLAIFMTIAIVKHSLLDIRIIVARSLAYLLLLTTTIAIYAILTFGIATRIFGENQFTEQVVPILMAIFVAFTVQPLRRFFAHVTNKFFYSDAYDAQTLLDEFNKVLVSTYDLEILLSRSASIIQDNLKPLYVSFVIKHTKVKTQRIVGTPGHPAFSDDDVGLMGKALAGAKGEIVAVDFIEQQDELQEALQRQDVALLGQLVGTASDKRSIGYLLLGHKKSGNLYDSQDMRAVKIMLGELAIAIQNAQRFEEIENFNITLQGKIDEATRRLRKTNDRLRVLDQTKDDFISMASHQLRTPLTSVKGYVSMVLDGDGGKINETQRKLLTQSFLSSQRMVYLISDLLNVSRLKTGKFIIEPIESNLANVIEEEVAQLVETVKSRGLELNYHKPENFPTLMYDETKIRQVIMNFIDNAIYYTPEGGHINVYLVDKPNSIEFTVVDDGIGVPKHEQHHLFSKFYRAKNAKSARPDGTGLGIFMAKKVIIAQGGAVIFNSTEGKGSTFGFTFPKAKLMPAKQAKAPALTSR